MKMRHYKGVVILLHQCIFCEGLYEMEESNAPTPVALCSKECEEGFRKHQEELEKEFGC
jgi:hypothetical protein